MLDKVKKAIGEFNMLTEGEAVLCCLSGGADSVTLLLCLYELGYDVSAMHINHGLRGEESDRDERFCIELCEELGIPLTVKAVDVKDRCRRTGKSVEESARELRYAAFESSPVKKIATAHTLSDSLETALFNLARGTGARGLCGIPPVRDRFVRPLIGCTRAEVETFLKERGREWVTDSTNLSDDYSRNRIRHGAVPVLMSLNPAAEQAFGRLSASLREDDGYLCAEALRLLECARTKDGYKLDILAAAPSPLLSRAVISLLAGRGLRYDESRVTELCRLVREGGRLCLSGNVYALSSTGLFRIAELEDPEEFCVEVEPGCDITVGGKRVTVEIIDKKQNNSRINNLFTYIELDYDKIKCELAVRNRRSGDKIRLAGRGCTKSIKKLFNETVPAEKRAGTLILCDSEGAAAIEGIGCADRVKCDESTVRVLRFGVGDIS